MAKRGAKPKGKVKVRWSPEFAYAIGLIVTDGNLSPDGRHIHFTSKDLELARLFQAALGINVKIGKKASGTVRRKKYHVVQFGDVLFYRFLLSIGLMPNKSKVIGAVKIPPRYFFDFLRGAFDGDGCTYSYFDPRWRSSFMFYTTFVSASREHISWLREEIFKRLKIRGHITHDGKRTTMQLKYAKADSLKLLRRMYHAEDAVSLSRKRLKVEKTLGIVGQHLYL
jgi:intein-encoded DNA endonuclease-like protein